MDHRLGNRVAVDLPIRWAQGGLPRAGRITDFSLSGAFIECGWDARTSPLIILDFPLAQAGPGTPTARVAAHVVRIAARGVGVEWCEFAVSAVAHWIRYQTEQPPLILATTEPVSRPIRAA
jgi:hypothetical protein